ncbi:MAG: beta strand repeat-containing protein [Opitutaceae bacterium]
MKNASKLRLSLRKLLIATLAVGPLAVLPAPVWATVPTSASGNFTVTSGTASVTAVNGGLVANIVASDRAVLVWNNGKLKIDPTETYSFILPSSSSSVLNKVGYNVDGSLATQDTAIISGELSSNGRVFILANGNIVVNSGSTINTGGLVLSTITESTDGAYTALGNLSYLGAATGNITLNNVNVAGGVNATSSTWGAIGGTVSGDLVLNSVTNGTALALAGSNALTVGGNLTIATTNGTVSQTNAISVGTTPSSAVGGVGSQVASISSGNAAITLNNASNNFQTVVVTTTGSAGAVSLADADLVRLGASTVGGDLQVVAVGLSANSSAAIATTGTLSVTGGANFTTNGTGAGSDGASVSIANNSTVVGTLSGSVSGNSSFSFNGTGPVTVGTVNAANGTARGGVTIVTDNAVTVTGIVSATGNNATNAGSISITGTSITQNASSALVSGNASRAGGVTLNATTGNITLGNITSNRSITLNASNGTISQVASTAIATTNATAGSSTLSVRSAGDATIGNADNVLSSGNVTFNVTGGGNATLQVKNTSADITLNSANVTGSLSLASNGKNITLGSGAGTSAASVIVNGNLTANAGAGNIADNDYSPFNVFGAVTLTGTNVTLDAAYKNGAISPSVRLGQINAAATNLELGETTTVNLGTVAVTNLMVQSSTGGIVDTGVITATNAVFAVTGNNSVVLADNAITNTAIRGGIDHSASNTITSFFGTSTIGGTTYTTSSTGNVTVAASGAASDLTLNALSAGNLSATAGQNLVIGGAAAVTGNATLTAAGTTTQTAGITVGGVTTINGTGAVTLGGANDFNSVVLNAGAAATISDINSLVLSGSAAGALIATSGSGTLANAWTLSVGNLSASTLSLTAGNGTAGNSGSITQQSGTALRSEGDASFVTAGASIVIDNSGNNFGRVSASTTGAAGGVSGAGSITIRESGTLKVGSIGANGTNATLTSETGNIIEDPATNTVLTLTNGTLTLNATAGSVVLDGSSRTAGTTTGTTQTFRVEAPNGAVKLFSSNANMTLSTINANSLTVTHTGSNNLTQSGRLNVYGGLSVTSAANITLSNTTNNFGRISLSATGAGKNITLTEANTVNLGTITQQNLATGNVTITSVNGDIIDTGLAGVKPGGGTQTLLVDNRGSGVITLNATKGNITLDDPTTDFQSTGGVVVNANNVVLSPLGATTLTLGAATGTSTIAGNLTATSATGSIAQAGNLSVTGDAVFQTGNGNINLTQTGNNFGTVRFTGTQVRIAEASDMAIVTGSSAIGASEFTTGGNLTIANRGGVVTFGTGGAQTILTATGSITLPKLVQSTGTIVLNAAGTKDLSALNQTADLAGKAPTNLGAGSYLPPSP